MTLDLVIANATLVTASDTFTADLGLAGETIAAVGRGLRGQRHIDATGLLALPGAIDSHVHLQYPQGPSRVVSADDWLTGTIAAVCGGTTSVIDFVEAAPGQSLLDAFAARRAQAAAEAVADFSFHMTLNRADDATLAEVPAVLAAGLTSFKIYMAYGGLRLDDSEILRAFDALVRHGGLPIIHAENHSVILHLVNQALAAGHTEPRWHPSTRPAAAEAEATERVLALAEVAGVPIHIVHVTAALGLDAIRRSRARRGELVTGEVCPQHLLLTEALYNQDGFAPAAYCMAPPLRTPDDLAAMWAGLRDGALDFVVTDHCPFTAAQKRGERRTPEFRRLPTGTVANPTEAPWSDGLPAFNRIPGGGPGLETRLPLLYHHGVNAGRLTPNQFVALTSTNIARRFGLYPRKGSLAPGADADIVLWDPRREVVLRAATLHQNCDSTPYEGQAVTGYPRTVLRRGQLVVDDGRFVGQPGTGRFLRRPM
jgi:dihydropyrimidinase